MECDSSCMFFFKQKSAYEMRISDWSSDVCSSDLEGLRLAVAAVLGGDDLGLGFGQQIRRADRQRLQILPGQHLQLDRVVEGRSERRAPRQHEIARASCRERVCQYG